MEGRKSLALIFILWGFKLGIILCKDCLTIVTPYGKISDSQYSDDRYTECWKIDVPNGCYALIKVTDIKTEHFGCSSYVEIAVAESEKHIFCGNDVNKNSVTALSSVTVTHYVNSHLESSEVYQDYHQSNFELEYEIIDLECLNENSFHCNKYTCIPVANVCDGVKNCIDGIDEIGCETGVSAIEGVTKVREKAISMLKYQRTASWGWKEDTPRAIIALHLALDMHFNGHVLEEELMAKQVELRTAVALLRSSLTNSELSQFVNALLVTCHNPRQFFGHNLVKRIKQQIEQTPNFTHPIAYLTLCNANETWPLKAITDLNDILKTESGYPFVKDLQAIAVMALSCLLSRSHEGSNNLFDSTNLTLYHETTDKFKEIQLEDGSFGNIYTTALITQALFSSGQEKSTDWKLNATMQYLMKKLNSSYLDFLSLYLTLPILNGKSLMDISKIDCSANPRKHGDDPVSEINQYLGPKIRVQYSLYIGNEKEIVHTISLKVPENYTASEVMDLAAVEDPKYQYKWKTMTLKMYVYEIASLTNDPETGNFWLLYVGTTNDSKSLSHLIVSPDELILNNEDHLVMWYKTANI